MAGLMSVELRIDCICVYVAREVRINGQDIALTKLLRNLFNSCARTRPSAAIASQSFSLNEEEVRQNGGRMRSDAKALSTT